jgi:hypothetical protein
MLDALTFGISYYTFGLAAEVRDFARSGLIKRVGDALSVEREAAHELNVEAVGTTFGSSRHSAAATSCLTANVERGTDVASA